MRSRPRLLRRSIGRHSDHDEVGVVVQICSMEAHGGLNSKAGEHVAHWGVDRVAAGL